jgi:riboflavin transporter FmnP
MRDTRLDINKLTLAAMFLALAWLMPFLSGQIPEFGNMLLLMHIPALLAGFVLGPKYGLLLGFIMPLSRSLIFGMPPLYPVSFAMAFELAAYGCVAGLVFRWMVKRFDMHIVIPVYVALAIAMIAGRLVWGVVMSVIGLFGGVFTLNMFLNAAFVVAWPGIIIQFLLIPAIIQVLHAGGLLDRHMP